MELLILVYILNTLGFVTVTLILAGLGLMGFFLGHKLLMWLFTSAGYNLIDGMTLTAKNDISGKWEAGDRLRINKCNNYCYLEKGAFSVKMDFSQVQQHVVEQICPTTQPLSRTYIYAGAFLFLLGGLLPNKQTATYMAGAYVLQTVVTSDEVKSLGDAAYRATMAQLNQWAEKSPELQTLIDLHKSTTEVEK
jgi:hypothetical protein